MDDEGPTAVGVVVESDRGSLPFALLHQQPLVTWAAVALEEAGVSLADLTASWDDVRQSGLPLVWHDALCPLTPPAFVQECLERCLADDVVVAGVLPVTDTVKELVGTPTEPQVGATHDREHLRHLASPVVLPPRVLAGLTAPPPTDFRSALRRLRAAGHEVVLVTAPEAARRVGSVDDLAVLEALSRR